MVLSLSSMCSHLMCMVYHFGDLENIFVCFSNCRQLFQSVDRPFHHTFQIDFFGDEGIIQVRGNMAESNSRSFHIFWGNCKEMNSNQLVIVTVLFFMSTGCDNCTVVLDKCPVHRK